MNSSTILVINTNPDGATRQGTRALVRAFKRIASPTVHVVERHFRRVAPDRLKKNPPQAVILGPQGVPFQSYDPIHLDALYCLIRSLECPVLGVCGGHQALVLAHGGRIAPVHGEKLPGTGTYGALKKIRGLHPMRRTARMTDRLLQTLPSPMTFFSSHVEAVSQLPPGFTTLATGPQDTIQMVRRDEYPHYGVQFHPERGGDGPLLMGNFLTLIRIESQ